MKAAALPCLVCVLVVAAGAAAPVSSAQADAADVRRLGADVAVMAADAGRLAEAALSPPHAAGLRQRLRGGLAFLALSVQAAREADPTLAALDETRLADLRGAFERSDWASAANGLAELTSVYRFNPAHLLPPDDRPKALASARAIHEAYCAGCHDDPDLAVARPAWNLFALGRAIPAAELAARLVIGVRGNNQAGLANPLSDAELSSLIALYRAEPVPAE